MTDLSQLEVTHRAMLAARAAQRHRDAEHRRETRVRRHLAVGVLSSIGFFLLLPLIDNVGTYVAACAALGVAVGSFARAVDLRIGYTWGRLYRDPQRISRFDRVMARLATRPESGIDAGEPQVRVLPPPG